MKKKILIIVHNDLFTDQRVLKQCASLSKKYITKVICLEKGLNYNFKEILPQCKVDKVNFFINKKIGDGNKKFSTKSRKTPNKHFLYKQVISLFYNKHIKNKIRHIFFNLKFIYKFTTSLIHYKPDVVHYHDINTYFLVIFSKLFSNAKNIYDVHEVNTSREGYRKSKITYYFENFLCRFADQIIITNELRKKFFLKLYKIKCKIEIIYNYPIITKVRKARFLKEKNKKIFIYQGGFSIGRNLITIAKLAFLNPKANFHMIGFGDLANKLRKYKKENNINNLIILDKKTPAELLNITQQADVGLQILENTCFNHYSADSNKIYEYLHANLAIVGSNFPLIKKIIKKNKVGLIVDPTNFNQINDAIKRLINNPNLIQKFKNNSKLCSHKYAWKSEKKKLYKIYNQLL